MMSSVETRTITHLDAPGAVLWDLDGTLIDSEPLWHAEQQQFVEPAGGTWTATDRRTLIGMTMTESSTYLLTRSPGHQHQMPPRSVTASSTESSPG